MKAYSFDDSGIFIGEYECQKDPIRSQKDGVDRYLIPANATLIAPPDFDESTQCAVWNGASWSVQEIPVPDPDELLAQEKEARIRQSKTDLAAYLEAHPLLWTDGKYYSITSEKQQWLTSKLFSAAAAKAAGEEYPLTWNDTEEVCRAWTYEDLWALARVIDARVTALVTYQQTQEVAIRNAATQEALDAIVVDYGTVPVPQLPEADQ